MKANQFSKKEEAQVGIGTMIVFIATILVAAVAAGVLIDTSQKLQSKSTQTGDAATQQVGSTLVFQTVYGVDIAFDNLGAADEGDLDHIDLWLKPASGADPINLEQLVIQLRSGTATRTFTYDDNTLQYDDGVTPCDAADLVEFFVYDTDGSTLATDRVLQAGERAMVRIGYDGDTVGDGTGDPLCNTSLDLGESSSLELELIPEVGSSVSKSFLTPNTFNGQTVFEF